MDGVRTHDTEDPGNERAALGRYGEDLAVARLEAAGWQVLDRNWRCREGELDIVAVENGVLVFLEVKTRSGRGYGAPVEAVDFRKARRIRVLAARWLAEHGPQGGRDLRFDVVSVLRERGHAPAVEHLRGAF